MPLKSRLLLLFQTCLTVLLGASLNGKTVPEYSFFKEPYVHPAIIEHMIGPISDTGANTIAYNLSKAQGSNQYHSPEYKLVHYPSGLEQVRFQAEFCDHWVRVDHPDGTAFEYQAVRQDEDGTVYLTCREHVTGSAGAFLHNIAVKLSQATLKDYQEDGTYKDYQYQRLEYAQILPYEFFENEKRFNKILISFVGRYEDKYKIEVFIEPWQRRMGGLECYATYYVTNRDSLKKGYFRGENIHLPKKFLKEYVVEQADPYRVEMNPDAPEFWVRFQYEPEPVDLTENIIPALGAYFNFIDLDFDGSKELVVRSRFAGQRHNDSFGVYDLEALEGDPEAESSPGIITDLKLCSLVELTRKSELPLSTLDEAAEVILADKKIKLYSSGGAYDSSYETYEWINGFSGDGWVLTREAGATTDTPNNILIAYDYEYIHSADKDGKLQSEKIVRKYERISYAD